MMKIPRTKKITNNSLIYNKKLTQNHNIGNNYVSNKVQKKNIKKGVKTPINMVYSKK